MRTFVSSRSSPLAEALLIFGFCSGVGAVRVQHFSKNIDAEHTEDVQILIKNGDVRNFLESRTLNGPMASHPNYSDFPVKGVYMFKGLGPAALEDFSYATNWDQVAHMFEFDMSHTLVLSGMPTVKYAGMGPFISGSVLAQVFKFLNYRSLFRCPESPMRDEQSCVIDAGMLSLDYHRDPLGDQYFIKHDGGRVYERKSTLRESEFHTYWMYRLVDEFGQIDEDHFKLFAEMLDGQDLVGYRPSEMSQ